MNNGMIATSDMLRLVGAMAICVGLAWAAQILGFDADGTALGRMMWVLGAAAIAGAGAGSIFTASRMREDEISI